MITVLKGDAYEFCFKPVQEDEAAPKLEVRRYEEALWKESLPDSATYVFTDFDRLNTNLRCEAARLYLRLQEAGCRVLNNPARVRTRFSLLRALHQAGLNPINVYLADEGVEPEQFPVFIRVADDHRGALSDLLHDKDMLSSAIEGAVALGIPRSEILIVEYCAQEVSSEVFRKSSVYKIADRYVRDIWWYGRFWDIKGDVDNLIGSDFYETELEEMRDNRFSDKVKEAFRIAEIDFGRLDFGVVGDDICIYEINTHPTFFGPRKHAVPARVESIQLRWSRLLDAFHAIDTQGDDANLVKTRGRSIKALKQAVSLSPELRYTNLRLSREHASRGEYEEAIEAARAEVAENPKSTAAVSNLAKLVTRHGETEEAISLIRRLVKDAPRNLTNWRRLARLLRESGRTEEARDCLAEGLTLSEDAWVGYLELAWLQRDLGELEAALKSGERALELGSEADERWKIYVLLAWVHRGLGQHENAADAAGKASSLAPEEDKVKALVRKIAEPAPVPGPEAAPKSLAQRALARAAQLVGRK